MHIDAQHRSSIYQKLLPILGEDDANALMTAFPSSDADELVTKDFLRAELAELRAELFGETSALRGEMGQLRGEMGDLRTEMAALENRLTVRLGAAIGASTSLMLAGLAILR
jgi:hypothetical protein